LYKFSFSDHVRVTSIKRKKGECGGLNNVVKILPKLCFAIQNKFKFEYIRLAVT